MASRRVPHHLPFDPRIAFFEPRLQRLARRASPMTEEELLANDLLLAAVYQAALERDLLAAVTG